MVLYGRRQPLSFIMEIVAIIGLALFVISEVIGYLPIRENSIVQAVLSAATTAFPKPEKPESFEEDAE